MKRSLAIASVALAVAVPTLATADTPATTNTLSKGSTTTAKPMGEMTDKVKGNVGDTRTTPAKPALGSARTTNTTGPK